MVNNTNLQENNTNVVIISKKLFTGYFFLLTKMFSIQKNSINVFSEWGYLCFVEIRNLFESYFYLTKNDHLKFILTTSKH
jgi:hypothetical protein